ncbi:MAG: hypothetical protein PVG65_01710 [Candidatus Thorarchaeota archaeon]|jgi:hypothetical protein
MRGSKIQLNPDSLYFVNFVLCIIILILGILAYLKKEEHIPLYIAIAFGLFDISHLATILGFKETLEVLLIGIRIIAYLLVILAVHTYWKI